MSLSVRPFQAASVPRPANLPTLAPIPSLLDVEIGCGVGAHAIHYAKSHANRFLVALEKSPVRFSTFQRTLASEAVLPNLLSVHANAISWITHTLPQASVDRYFLLYPNPNPKKKHLHLRWHAMPFMHHLLDTLKPQGTLHLATNVEPYAEEARLYFREVWQLNEALHECLHRNTHPDFLARTHFEKKYLARGETCHNLIFQKP